MFKTHTLLSNILLTFLNLNQPYGFEASPLVLKLGVWGGGQAPPSPPSSCPTWRGGREGSRGKGVGGLANALPHFFKMAEPGTKLRFGADWTATCEYNTTTTDLPVFAGQGHNNEMCNM